MRVDCHCGDTPVWRLRFGPDATQADDAIRIDPGGVRALLAALDRAEADPAARVIVVEGQSGIFCQGMDLAYLVAHAEGGAADAPPVGLYARCLSRLHRSPKLVIAVVDGVVEGGGLGFAAAADLCLASASSRFALPELVLGLLPAVVYPALRLRLSPQRARGLCLSGPMDGRGAQAIGLVDDLAEDGPALEKVLRSRIKHALRLQPAALAELKQLGVEIEEGRFERAHEAGVSSTPKRFSDPDALAQVEAFLAGATPPWFARYRPKASEERG